MPDNYYENVVPATRDEAADAARRYFQTGDEAEISAAVEAMLSQDSEQAFAIMRGSGNDMDLMEQFVSLCRDSGLLTRQDAFDLLIEYSDFRQGARP